MLAFCNGFTEDVWVAYMFHSPDDCGGEEFGDWQTIGWFHITPGACATVYANTLDDVNNRFWYLYAENAGRNVVWDGPIRVNVSQKAFNHCLLVATGTDSTGEHRVVGFRVFDVGDNDDFTVTLIA